MNASRRWALSIGCCAALAVAGYYSPSGQMVHWVFKPLTTLLIAAMVWSFPATKYRRWVLLGLLLSTLGDVFLMLPGDLFVQGLLSFLVAHGFYLLAFRNRAKWFEHIQPFAIYLGVVAFVMVLLWPSVPASLRVPVLIYVAALGAMAAQAGVAWQVRRDRASGFAAVGGLLFVVSDSVIAINRFSAPFEYAKAVVLISYWAAQWLIARSVLRPAEQAR